MIDEARGRFRWDSDERGRARHHCVAPFYYDWPITLALVDKKGSVAKTIPTTWNVSSIASGASVRFAAEFPVQDVKAGRYTVVAQVTNPLPGGLPVRFANAAQDADRDGWLTLGAMTVAAGGHR